MKKRIIFHFGVHKTGSTALQFALIKHENILKKQGIIHLNRNYFFSAFYRLFYQHRDPQFDAFRLDLMKDTLNETLQKEFPDAHTFIISDEKCSYCNPFHRYYLPFDTSKEGPFIAHRKHFFKRLAHITQDFDVTHHLYLRTQDRLLESLYIQCVKSLHFFTFTFHDFLSIYPKPCLNWKSLLSELKTAFPSSTIIARLFDKRSLVSQDVVTDFFTAHQIPLPDGYVAQTKNTQLKSQYVETVRGYNHFLSHSIYPTSLFNQFLQKPFLSKWNTLIHKPLLDEDLSRRYLSEHYDTTLFDTTRSERYTLFDNTSHDSIMTYYKTSNRYVENHHFSSEHKFTPISITSIPTIKQYPLPALTTDEQQLYARYLYGDKNPLTL